MVYYKMLVSPQCHSLAKVHECPHQLPQRHGWTTSVINFKYSSSIECRPLLKPAILPTQLRCDWQEATNLVFPGLVQLSEDHQLVVSPGCSPHWLLRMKVQPLLLYSLKHVIYMQYTRSTMIFLEIFEAILNYVIWSKSQTNSLITSETLWKMYLNLSSGVCLLMVLYH